MNIEIKRINENIVLIIDDVVITITDYLIKSSADGTTELMVKLKFNSTIFEMSTILK